jgi:hypothetical protein
MMRLLNIQAVSLLLLSLPGCNNQHQDQPIWQQIKIGDLAPAQDPNQTSRLLKGVGVKVFVIEMPADNFEDLDRIWEVMYKQPFLLANPGAFKANSFAAGFGQIHMWHAIAQLLDKAHAKRVATRTMLLAHGQTNDHEVIPLPTEQTVFYVDNEGSRTGIRLGPGKLVLRIRAEQVPGIRGLSAVTAQMVFVPPGRILLPFLARQANANEFEFVPAGFKLRMSPGDFFLLGPVAYTTDRLNLASRVFYKPQGSMFFVPSKENPAVGKIELMPAIRLFLVACSGIND